MIDIRCNFQNFEGCIESTFPIWAYDKIRLSVFFGTTSSTSNTSIAILKPKSLEASLLGEANEESDLRECRRSLHDHVAKALFQHAVLHSADLRYRLHSRLNPRRRRSPLFKMKRTRGRTHRRANAHATGNLTGSLAPVICRRKLPRGDINIQVSLRARERRMRSKLARDAV